MYKDELVTLLSIVGPTAHSDSNFNGNSGGKVAADENTNAPRVCRPQFSRRLSALLKSASDAEKQELNACKFDLLSRTQFLATKYYARH